MSESLTHVFSENDFYCKVTQGLFDASHYFESTCSFILCYSNFSVFVEGVGVWGGMFVQAAAVHRSSSSAVDQLCAAVPTGCSGGLPPCVWRGAEGRLTPEWGSRTGAAGTVLLPQERAVQTAWRSTAGGGRRDDTQPHTKIQTHKHVTEEDTRRRSRTERMDEKTKRQTAEGGGQTHESSAPEGESQRQKKDCGKESRGNPVKKKKRDMEEVEERVNK